MGPLWPPRCFTSSSTREMRFHRPRRAAKRTRCSGTCRAASGEHTISHTLECVFIHLCGYICLSLSRVVGGLVRFSPSVASTFSLTLIGSVNPLLVHVTFLETYYLFQKAFVFDSVIVFSNKTRCC